MNNSEQNPVYILGGGINALGIIRSFQNTKIQVTAFSWYKDYGMSSRFCSYKICPNPLFEDKLIDYLIEIATKLKYKPVLFATSDLFLMPVVKNLSKLKDYYYIPICDWSILSKLIKKEFLYKFAEDLDIPCPRTIIIRNNNELLSAVKQINLPIIIKPSVNINFSAELGSKAFVLKTDEELNILVNKILKTDLCLESLVVQEYIPGEVSSLYTITSYANKHNEIFGYSIGHKIRQFPPESGTIISGKVIHVEEILEHAIKFIKATQFFGISNIEFKKDSRDGIYKLMEINPRTGVWNLSALESGVNLPILAYKDILGIDVKKEFNKNASLIWLITPLDFYYSIFGYVKKGFPEYKISFKEWRKSIKGKKVDSCFKWYDFMPFFKGLIMKYK